MKISSYKEFEAYKSYDRQLLDQGLLDKGPRRKWNNSGNSSSYVQKLINL